MARRGQQVQRLPGTDAGDGVHPEIGAAHAGCERRGRDVFDLHAPGPVRVVPFDGGEHGLQPPDQRVIGIAVEHGQQVEVAALGQEVPADERAVHVQAEQAHTQFFAQPCGHRGGHILRVGHAAVSQTEARTQRPAGRSLLGQACDTGAVRPLEQTPHPTPGPRAARPSGPNRAHH